jgi:hypothetical protein
LADSEASVGVDFGDGVGLESVAFEACGSRDGICCLAVVGDVHLVSESPMKKAVGGGGLSWATDLATPETAKLRCLHGVAWHWNFE